MSISKFWKTYPPFCETKNFKTWQPCSVICHFCLSEVVESVLVPKNPSSRIFTSFRLLVHNLRLFQGFFRKKFNVRPLFQFWFFAVPVSRKIYLLLQFSRYRGAVFGILLATKLSTRYKNLEQNFEFLPQEFLQPLKVKKKFRKKNI